MLIGGQLTDFMIQRQHDRRDSLKLATRQLNLSGQQAGLELPRLQAILGVKLKEVCVDCKRDEVD